MNNALKSMIVLKYYNQENFSEAIGERPSLVSQVIRGRRKIPLEKKIKWAVALDCSVSDVFPNDPANS